MIFGKINVARTPVFNACAGRNLFCGLTLTVPDTDCREMKDAPSPLPDLEAKIRFFQKEKKALVQAAQCVPGGSADQHKGAHDSFNGSWRIHYLLLAGKPSGKEPAQ